MESSSSWTSLQYPVRSISLPSRLHPHSFKLEAELDKLRTWETSLVPTVPSSAETTKSGLIGLAQLYNCFEELVHSPATQQALVQHQDGILIEEALEGSIGLLDSCSKARDLLSILKENVRNLQSVLRRKGEVLSIRSGINAYTSCKRKVKKETAKCLKTLKQMDNKIGSAPLLDANPHLSMVIRVLGEVVSVTISILRSVFLFLSVPVSKTKLCRWSLISTVFLTTPSKTNYKTFNEVESVDDAFQSLKACICSSNSKIEVESARKRLQVLEAGVEGLEDGLDCLFRCLIQNRVSLLNILAK